MDFNWLFSLLAFFTIVSCERKRHVKFEYFDDYLMNLEEEQINKQLEANNQWSLGQGRPVDSIDRYDEMPTDDEDLLQEGSGWPLINDKADEMSDYDQTNPTKSKESLTKESDLYLASVAQQVLQQTDDSQVNDDSKISIFGLELPNWFGIPLSHKNNGSTVTGDRTNNTTSEIKNATTSTPNTITTVNITTQTTTVPTTTKQTTTRRQELGRFSKGSSRYDHINHESSVGILAYFKDVPREHWSCCMLGLLAGDKGFHCHAQYYAARISMRNTNRAHNRKMGFMGNSADPNWGQQTMQSFQRCIARKADEFHKCCYAATIEKREMVKWDWYRRRRENGEDEGSVEDYEENIQRGDVVRHLTNEMISDGGLSGIEDEEDVGPESEDEDQYVPTGRQRPADITRRRLTTQQETEDQDSTEGTEEQPPADHDYEASRKKRRVLQEIAKARAQNIRQRVNLFRQRRRNAWRHHARIDGQNEE